MVAHVHSCLLCNLLAGVAAFSGGQGGNEGQLFAALLVNAVQLVSNIICIIFVDKASRHLSFMPCHRADCLIVYLTSFPP